MLMNLMPVKAYVGVFLGSGGCLHALKRLVETEYYDFAAENEKFPDPSNLCKLLWESMDSDDKQQRIERAWSIFAGWKLDQLGFGCKWKIFYIELYEFSMMLLSYSVFQVGTW